PDRGRDLLVLLRLPGPARASGQGLTGRVVARRSDAGDRALVDRACAALPGLGAGDDPLARRPMARTPARAGHGARCAAAAEGAAGHRRSATGVRAWRGVRTLERGEAGLGAKASGLRPGRPAEG